MDHMQHFPPGILTCPDPSEFDYSTFLQQVEDIPFPDPSHNTSAGTISESPLGQAPAARSDGWSMSGAADMSVMRRQSAQKQRPERRGHTKSRRGCYNCKRRRIKCQETRPACGHCVKTGLKCEYPSLPQITYQLAGHAILPALPHPVLPPPSIKARGGLDLAEYITFIRGIVIVGVQMVFKGIKPIFEQLLDEDWQDEVMEPYLRDLPLIQRGWAAAAIQAISNLRPLCVEPVEVEYCEQLLGIAEKLNVNSFDAYKANSRQYAWWTMLPHSTFQQLINLDRQSMILLHAHWIALSQIMAFITEREHDVREKRPSASTNSGSAPGSVGWLKFLNARVDYEHQMYNQWPLWVEAQLDKDLTFFGLRL
ncbi:C6 transcription factor [Metarhizium guizhouense ARSEF 977]|uniref:C6 transcription factor n=1 Tax=Metarhizium guizhouense (strain ARSEF 977) TaxID=1276136 RepID=A0A0B4H2A7_METGA|nr:C6 transcription factor [Metarhizium guizhouense ARSEF 977]